MFDPFPGRAAGKRAPFTRQMGLVIIPAGNGDMRQGVRSVDPATVHGRRLSLPQEICSVSLRRLRLPKGGLTAAQRSAEGIVGHDVGKASEELTSFLLWMNRLCSRLLANRDEFISELFSLPFEFGFQGFLAVDVACCPDGLVVFDLTLHDCVKHNRNLVGGGGGGSRWPDFALHAAEIISHRC